MLLALIVAGWAGAVIVRRTLRPLDRVAATATRVSELRAGPRRGGARAAGAGGGHRPRTEVGQVGAALNRMLDHVGSALEARHASEMQVRQFVADASHELRTPLAAIRGYAELSRRSRQPVPDEVGHVLRRVESEAQRMTALVEDLLLLARLDAGRPLAHDPVDLTMLVVDAVSDAHAAGPRHDWQLDLPEEPVHGHRRRGAAAPGAGQSAGQRAYAHPGGHHRDGRGERDRRPRPCCGSPTPGRASRPSCSRTSSSGSPAATARGRGRPAAPAWGCRSCTRW